MHTPSPFSAFHASRTLGGSTHATVEYDTAWGFFKDFDRLHPTALAIDAIAKTIADPIEPKSQPNLTGEDFTFKVCSIMHSLFFKANPLLPCDSLLEQLKGLTLNPHDANAIVVRMVRDRLIMSNTSPLIDGGHNKVNAVLGSLVETFTKTASKLCAFTKVQLQDGDAVEGYKFVDSLLVPDPEGGVAAELMHNRRFVLRATAQDNFRIMTSGDAATPVTASDLLRLTGIIEELGRMGIKAPSAMKTYIDRSAIRTGVAGSIEDIVTA